MAEHRRKPARKYMKKAATVSGVVATATAMTVGMAAPPANASNYTQLITDSSNSFNNLLFINGNVGGAAGVDLESPRELDSRWTAPDVHGEHRAV